MSKPPAFIECSVCGCEFGSRSIGIHEPQCLQKLRMTEIKEEEGHNGKGRPRRKKKPSSVPNTVAMTIGTREDKGGVSLPKIIHSHGHSSSRQRPTTATLERPRILNPEYKHYDMTLTRIDFTPRKLPVMNTDDNQIQNSSGASRSPINTSGDRSSCILPSTMIPATPAPGTEFQSPNFGTSQQKVSSPTFPGPSKNFQSGMMHTANVVNGLLGDPLTQTPPFHVHGQGMGLVDPLFSRQTENKVAPTTNPHSFGECFSPFPSNAYPMHPAFDEKQFEQNPHLAPRTESQPKPLPQEDVPVLKAPEVGKGTSRSETSDLPYDEAKRLGLDVKGGEGEAATPNNHTTSSVNFLYINKNQQEPTLECYMLSCSNSESSLSGLEEPVSVDRPLNIQVVDDDEPKVPVRPQKQSESGDQKTEPGGIIQLFNNVVGFFTPSSGSGGPSANKVFSSLQILDPIACSEESSTPNPPTTEGGMLKPNVVTSKNSGKSKSGHKSISFNLASTVYRYDSPHLAQEETSESTPRQTKSDSHKPEKKLDKCHPSLPTSCANEPTSEIPEPAFKRVVSSRTLLRNGSKSLSFSKKPLENVTIVDFVDEDAKKESVTNVRMSVSRGSHKRVKEIEILSDTDTDDVCESMVEGLVKQYEKEISPKISSHEAVNKSMPMSKQESSKAKADLSYTNILKNLIPMQIGGGYHRKSINTKTSKPREEVLGADVDVPICEGAQGGRPSETDEDDSEIEAERPPQSATSRPVSSVSNASNPSPAMCSILDKASRQLKVKAKTNKNKVEKDGKKKKKKEGFTNDLLNSIARLHDLNANRKFDIRYTVALSQAVYDASLNMNPDRPYSSPAAPTGPAYVEEVPQQRRTRQNGRHRNRGGSHTQSSNVQGPASEGWEDEQLESSANSSVAEPQLQRESVTFDLSSENEENKPSSRPITPSAYQKPSANGRPSAQQRPATIPSSVKAKSDPKSRTQPVWGDENELYEVDDDAAWQKVVATFSQIPTSLPPFHVDTADMASSESPDTEFPKVKKKKKSEPVAPPSDAASRLARLATPKWVNNPYINNFVTGLATFYHQNSPMQKKVNSLSSSNINNSRRPSAPTGSTSKHARSLGKVATTKTQTPAPQEKLLTPTVVRRQLKSAAEPKQIVKDTSISSSSGNNSGSPPNFIARNKASIRAKSAQLEKGKATSNKGKESKDKDITPMPLPLIPPPTLEMETQTVRNQQKSISTRTMPIKPLSRKRKEYDSVACEPIKPVTATTATSTGDLYYCPSRHHHDELTSDLSTGDSGSEELFKAVELAKMTSIGRIKNYAEKSVTFSLKNDKFSEESSDEAFGAPVEEDDCNDGNEQDKEDKDESQNHRDYKHIPSEPPLDPSVDHLKLKKVKVTKTEEADHVGLRYTRRRHRSRSSHQMPEVKTSVEGMGELTTLPSVQPKCSETKGFITFSDMVMIVPSKPPEDKEFIDLNIVVRRKYPNGSFPDLEDIVSEINSENFYLIIDEIDSITSRIADTHRSPTDIVVDKLVNDAVQRPKSPRDKFISLLVDVSEPISEESTKEFEVRNFGKIPEKRLAKMMRTHSIPVYCKEVETEMEKTKTEDYTTQTEDDTTEKIIEQAESRHRINRAKSPGGASRSVRVVNQIRSLKSVDMDTWGLSCLATHGDAEEQAEDAQTEMVGKVMQQYM